VQISTRSPSVEQLDLVRVSYTRGLCWPHHGLTAHDADGLAGLLLDGAAED
jgi:hypothetical protein